jgi:hypothetical protein
MIIIIIIIIIIVERWGQRVGEPKKNSEEPRQEKNQGTTLMG